MDTCLLANIAHLRNYSILSIGLHRNCSKSILPDRKEGIGNLFIHLQSFKKDPERCLRGRKEQFAKLSYELNRTEGSNPSLSAFARRSGLWRTQSAIAREGGSPAEAIGSANS